MVDSALIPAIKEAVKQNEIGDASPFELSYAELDKSGASFGAMQGDTHVSELARSTLREVLQKAGVNTVRINRIMELVEQLCPNGNPLNPDDTKFANDALDTPAGRALIDQMDAKLLQAILRGVDAAVAAADKRNITIAPEAQLYIACWVNMTGPPDKLLNYLSGKSELGLTPPSGPTFGEVDIVTYLNATEFFQKHPKNRKHLHDSVHAAFGLLPTA
jgi:hypothetical protein